MLTVYGTPAYSEPADGVIEIGLPAVAGEPEAPPPPQEAKKTAADATKAMESNDWTLRRAAKFTIDSPLCWGPRA